MVYIVVCMLLVGFNWIAGNIGDVIGYIWDFRDRIGILLEYIMGYMIWLNGIEWDVHWIKLIKHEMVKTNYGRA